MIFGGRFPDRFLEAGAFDDDAVREAIGQQAPITPVAVLPVGYSAEFSGRPARRPLSEVTVWI